MYPFENEVLKLCYDSVWSMFDRWRYILPTLPLNVSEKQKLGEPKEEIGNLIMDLNICILMIPKHNICKSNICILVILRYNISNLNISVSKLFPWAQHHQVYTKI